jgi:hypothetical protein
MIFEEKNEIFMIPECSANKRLEVYICKKFPNEWSLYSTAFEGEIIADVTYFSDPQFGKWLFLNKDENGNREFYGTLNSNLYLYKIDSLKFNSILEHQLNPVIIDSRKARNAGPLFNYKGKIHRPSQNNSFGRYGYGFGISTIEELSLETFKEKEIISVLPEEFGNDLIATHHLHQHDNFFIVDGAFDLS